MKLKTKMTIFTTLMLLTSNAFAGGHCKVGDEDIANTPQSVGQVVVRENEICSIKTLEVFTCGPIVLAGVPNPNFNIWNPTGIIGYAVFFKESGERLGAKSTFEKALNDFIKYCK